MAHEHHPNFLVIGAGRCGTTTLCAILGDHPDVFISDPKELGFFCTEERYARGMAWYSAHFRGAEGKLAAGEGSVNNSKRHICPDAAQRIARHLPDARLLYIVRHPIEQIRSNWSYAFATGAERRPFKQAVLEDPGYLATCDYEWQLNAFREAYGGRENLLILFMEDLKRDAPAIAAQAFRFLGVDPGKWNPQHVHENAIDGVRGQKGFAEHLRHLPGYGFLRRRVPKPLRALWSRALEAPARDATSQSSWEPSMLKQVLPVLEPRSELFLRAHGKQPGYWDFTRYRELASGAPTGETAPL